MRKKEKNNKNLRQNPKQTIKTKKKSKETIKLQK